MTDRLHVWVGLADDAPVCPVVLRGPFLLREISLPPGHPGGPAHSEPVTANSDTSTGRLLLGGVGDRPDPVLRTLAHKWERAFVKGAC